MFYKIISNWSNVSVHLIYMCQYSNYVFLLQILSRDSVTVSVDAVIYARIFDATMSIINVENAHASTKLLAATTLRNVLGTKQLSEILSDRESIAQQMQASVWRFAL